MNPSVKIEIRRELEWLAFEYAKTLEKWQKRKWRSNVKYRGKKISCVKCMNYTHKTRQKWRWRVWLQSSRRWCWLTDRCVDENVNNGTYFSDLILKGQREEFQNDLFVVLLLSLTVIYSEKHTSNDLFTALYSNWQNKHCNTMVQWYIPYVL